MKVAVWGFGHFANVLCCALVDAACAVRQEDADPYLLRIGQPDGTDEPGYHRPLNGGFYGSPDVIWAAYDVPLDQTGRSQDGLVLARLRDLWMGYPSDIPLVVSTQWRVGSTAQLEALRPVRSVTYVMENVRVGHALADLSVQPHVIVGHRGLPPSVVCELLAHFGASLCCMSPESAEMSKHALNGFLALNIAYANEIARIATAVNADPLHVMAAVQTDPRVSAVAPLRPGKPFGGGSLERDVLTLETLSNHHHVHAPLVHLIRASNEMGAPA